MLNIAEGNGRPSTKDYIKFLQISLGSINEIEAITKIAIRQKMLTDMTYQKFSRHLSKILWKLIRLIKSLQIKEEYVTEKETVKRPKSYSQSLYGLLAKL